VKALFDIEGLYVWHCHILSHEDNEMMVPYYVGDPANSPLPVVPVAN
jgi:FtsP/CotA-like multicopper oxidase with cupredoxin domain